MNERDNELWKQSLYDGDRAESTIAHFAELIRADERERIKAANAPEIERINVHLKSLEDAVLDEREACAKLADEIDPVWESLSFAIRARGNT